MDNMYDVIIIGSGPAGYTAAIYSSRAMLKTLLIEGYEMGGALMNTTEVENYPGSPDSILGPDLMMSMRDQAEKFGAVLLSEQADRVNLTGEIKKVYVDDNEYLSKTVILATGSEARKLHISGEDEYAGRGVSYCATCDGFFFQDKKVVVVGGGDSAMEEALFLSKYASEVTIINRSTNYRASSIMKQRAENNNKINFVNNYIPYSISGDGKQVTPIHLRGVLTRDIKIMDTDAVFVAIGHDPRNEMFKDVVNIDKNGYVVTYDNSTKTNIAGVFAAGDLTDSKYQQAITAAGSGCKAAIDAEEYINNILHQ